MIRFIDSMKSWHQNMKAELSVIIYTDPALLTRHKGLCASLFGFGWKFEILRDTISASKCGKRISKSAYANIPERPIEYRCPNFCLFIIVWSLSSAPILYPPSCCTRKTDFFACSCSKERTFFVEFQNLRIFCSFYFKSTNYSIWVIQIPTSIPDFLHLSDFSSTPSLSPFSSPLIFIRFHGSIPAPFFDDNFVFLLVSIKKQNLWVRGKRRYKSGRSREAEKKIASGSELWWIFCNLKNLFLFISLATHILRFQCLPLFSILAALQPCASLSIRNRADAN